MTVSNRSLRICLPAGIFPPDTGGPASYVPRIAAALADRGHSVNVIALADDPLSSAKFPFPVARIQRSMPRLRRMGRTVMDLVRQARQADVVFANGLFIEAAFAAAIVRKPLVMKIVGDWAWERARNNGQGSDRLEVFQKERQAFRWETVKALRSFVTRRANVVIVPSQYLAGIVAAWGFPVERISVIYNALDPLPKSLPKQMPEFSGSTLICVARLVRWKGIDRLIDFVAARVDLRLVIVGDGPERVALDRLAVVSGAKARVLFAGNVPREQVGGWMRAADIFVLNSSYEGLPHIVLEAFAAEVPVIATAAGGTPEIVRDGENGLLIPSADDHALAEAIARLRKTPDLRQTLIAGGRRTLVQNFQWDALVEQTEHVLSVAAGRPA
jgi:glycosyltransferase involved in cell wall biosynthesis